MGKIIIDEKCDECEGKYIGNIDLGVMGNFTDITVELDDYDMDDFDDEDEENPLVEALEFYEDRFAKLEKDKENIGEQFLMWFITNLCDCKFPFWQEDINENITSEYPSYINIDEMKKFHNEDGVYIHDINCSSEIYKEISEYDVDENKDNLTSHEIVEKYLKVLNLDEFIKIIEPDYISASGEEINFQLSSKACGGFLLCSTYGEIDEDNVLTVTDNC